MDMKRPSWQCTNRRGTKVLVSSMLNTLSQQVADQAVDSDQQLAEGKSLFYIGGGGWGSVYAAAVTTYCSELWRRSVACYSTWLHYISVFSGCWKYRCCCRLCYRVYSFCAFVYVWIVWFVVGGEFPGIETSFSVGKLLPWQRSRAACAGKYIASANLFLNSLFQCSLLLDFTWFIKSKYSMYNLR